MASLTEVAELDAVWGGLCPQPAAPAVDVVALTPGASPGNIDPHLCPDPLNSVPRYTAEEVRRFPDDHLRYEVIRGDLVVTPAPGTAHQRAVLELARRLQE